MLKPSHHPPHIYLDDTWYIITSSAYQCRRLFRPHSHKEFIRDRLKELAAEFGLKFAAWVILDNHYHILVKSKVATELSRFFARLHGRASFELNRRDNARGRQVWHNYWDTCIRSEKDYWTRFNYIHHNPVKHGYVKRMEDWEFSSYRYYMEHKGAEWLADIAFRNPIVDYTDPRDEF